ncbi:hypothetical protein T4D_7557 [Trichinella pseudospiralis]|uniref:Uncharacterized protein n=1 Tax=Trichinella pseudospiralis TaxID=6337 RepID=A0A0V1G3G0_TRIPS|nr:hypothetical protein T4D_7557 [Trichinella pseudospiralis]
MPPARTAGGFWRQALMTRHVGNYLAIVRRGCKPRTISKTIEDQISVDPPRCPPPPKGFYILEQRRPRGIFLEQEQ